MTDWFARPVLHVTDVEASLRFYVNRLGFTSPWRYDEEGRAHVAQVDRQGCALILADTWSWGYRLLVVDDPDGNQLFFNYPNETASRKDS
ncbi:MAG: hypothetical protein DMG37_01005 [Acidobacteria bacterium]|nr:MAG: hypothetical protein DMG37_01005 [Acidobacteriota bacterium]